jgi:Zn2+/Cd2+-exporting ATPase
MTQLTHQIPISLVLPSKDHAFQCSERLKNLLQEEKNIDKVHIVTKSDTQNICIHFSPQHYTLAQIEALVKIAGASIDKRYQHETLQILLMDSPDCAKVIEHSLGHLPGIINAKVSYVAQQLRIEYDNQQINLKKLLKHIATLGYKATLEAKPATWWQKNHELVLSIAAGIALLIGKLLPSHLGGLSHVFIGIAFISAGWLTLKDSVQTLMQKRFDIDVLMLIAAIGAASLGAWAEGALLLFLFSLGHALEHKALDKARNAVKALANLAPNTATVKRDSAEIEISIDEIQLDDIVIVKPSQSIPVDGEIIEGISAVNQAPITGESIPVDKKPGDKTFAGTINGDGRLLVKVTKLAQNSMLNRMVKLVLEADTQNSPTQNFTQQFVKYFVPTILVIVIAAIFLPPLWGQSWYDSFYRAMAMLVASSPCALAIATPAAILSGVARAAQKGVLIKGGMHLENLGRIQAIAFDKTGTLTEGKPQVIDIITIEANEDELIQSCASLEKLSTHPLAKAVIQLAKEKDIPVLEVSDMQSITGKGLQGTLNGQTIQVGSLKLFDTPPPLIIEKTNELLKNGKTVMIVKVDKRYLGLLGIADKVRDSANATLANLKSKGILHTIMLTGDNQFVADNIAQLTGIEQVRANLLPEDKLNEITQLEKKYQHIAMVGDGVNDAPSMARATVGIAMGGAGTDVALEASDIALMGDDLSKLPFAVSLSRKASRIIKQNLWGSLSVVAVLLIATVTGLAGIGLAVLIHEGSTLVVVANALRLLKHPE